MKRSMTLTTGLATLVLMVATTVTAADELPERILDVDSRPSPPLELTSLNGERYRLPERPGHWVMVHFWASWCGPCRRELPTIQSMSDRLAETSLELVLVNTAETEDEAFTFLATVAPRLDTLMDKDGRTTDRWQPRGLPASFFVSPEGKIEYMALGGRPWDTKAYLAFLRSLVESGS